jgi:hypothetical protein
MVPDDAAKRSLKMFPFTPAKEQTSCKAIYVTSGPQSIGRFSLLAFWPKTHVALSTVIAPVLAWLQSWPKW